MPLSNPNTVTILQGEFQVSHNPEVVLSTVLGSCVAMCLFDLEQKIGGMNHFLLPDGGADTGGSVKYGTHAVELLINELLKKGAQRSNLKAKLFGGAHLQSHLSDIGGSNALFAREFIRDEGIECLGESLGGPNARRLKFWPTTGSAKQLLVPITEAPKPIEPKVATAAEAEIELF